MAKGKSRAGGQPEREVDATTECPDRRSPRVLFLRVSRMLILFVHLPQQQPRGAILFAMEDTLDATNIWLWASLRLLLMQPPRRIPRTAYGTEYEEEELALIHVSSSFSLFVPSFLFFCFFSFLWSCPFPICTVNTRTTNRIKRSRTSDHIKKRREQFFLFEFVSGSSAIHLFVGNCIPPSPSIAR